MKFLKPKFWDNNNNLIPYFLLPISFFLQLLVKIKNYFIHQHNCRIPIICVGNIYLGGTGKTPLAIKIAEELIKIKKKPSVIKKFYSDHSKKSNIENEINDNQEKDEKN